MKITKKVRTAIIGFTALIFLYLFLILLYGSITKYQPDSEIIISPDQPGIEPIIKDSLLSFTTWNIGYCGLGAESDFFFSGSGFLVSGGKMVRPSALIVEKNFQGVKKFIETTKDDFILLQEVDFESKRSYYTDQYTEIAEMLDQYSAVKAINFKVKRVPAPIFEPWKAYGRCLSGLSSFSRFQPSNSVRYQLPGKFNWPQRLFLLDRCISFQRFNTVKGKDLVLINVHNSAYDKDGAIKTQQLNFLKQFLVLEFEKGNYVVCGGDWNMCPPEFDYLKFSPRKTIPQFNPNIPEDFIDKEWQWAYDPEVPTVRSNQEKYSAKNSSRTLIDYFLISPNIELIEVKGEAMGFEFSDHQPVRMKVKLK